MAVCCGAGGGLGRALTLVAFLGLVAGLVVAIPGSAGVFWAPGGVASGVGAPVAARAAFARAVAAKKAKPVANLSYVASLDGRSRLMVVFTSNAAKVAVEYQLAKKVKGKTKTKLVARTKTLNVRKGTARVLLSASHRNPRAQAKATSKLRASRWVVLKVAPPPPPPIPTLTPSPTPPPSPTSQTPSIVVTPSESPSVSVSATQETSPPVTTPPLPTLPPLTPRLPPLPPWRSPRPTVTRSPPPPTAPWAVTLTAGDGAITATWAQSTSFGWFPVTYTATATPGGRGCTTTTLSCTITDLTNGILYVVTITAADDVGVSAPSQGVIATPHIVALQACHGLGRLRQAVRGVVTTVTGLRTCQPRGREMRHASHAASSASVLKAVASR